MKYVFFGTPRFAEIVLRQLMDAGIPPVALVCNPDKPAGRKKTMTAPRTKQFLLGSSAADRSPVAIFQPEKLDEGFARTLNALHADLFLVAAYAKIIPKTVLDLPARGTFGIHPSLLPKYRGSSPIQSAILHGEKETGVTIYQLDEKMDHGPIAAQKKIPLESITANYGELEAILAEAGVKLFAEIAPGLAAGRKPDSWRAQEDAVATYTRKFTSQDAFISPEDLTAAEHGDRAKAETILRIMNAFTPEPGAWTRKSGVRIKLLKAEMRGDALHLLAIQEEGGKPRAIA